MRRVYILSMAAGWVLLASCSGGTGPKGETPPQLGALTAVSGQGQEAWPGQALKNFLVAEALDTDGQPLAGVTVQWTVTAGGGQVDRTSSVTGPDGTAVASWTLGYESTNQTLTANAGDSASTEFTAEAAITGTWTPVASLLHPVRAPAVTTDGQKIFVFGGADGTGARTAYTQIFDPATNTWSTGADVPKPVEWSAAVYADGRVHLLGGVTNETAATNEQWIYDPAADAWTAGQALPTPAAGAAAALVGGQIIVAGGIDGPGDYADHVQILDLAPDSWSSGTPTPAALINWQAAAIDGEVFVAGGTATGRVTSSALYRYDPSADSWASLQPLPSKTEGFGGTEVLGAYCVLGGRVAPASGSFNTPLDLVECFEPQMNQWLSGPKLPTAVEELGATSIDGVLYAIGGRVSVSGVIGEVYRLGS